MIYCYNQACERGHEGLQTVKAIVGSLIGEYNIPNVSRQTLRIDEMCRSNGRKRS